MEIPSNGVPYLIRRDDEVAQQAERRRAHRLLAVAHQQAHATGDKREEKGEKHASFQTHEGHKPLQQGLLRHLDQHDLEASYLLLILHGIELSNFLARKISKV